MKTKHPSLSFLAIAVLCAPLLQAKPLKVFILAGQSNMEGHAESYTFSYIAKFTDFDQWPKSIKDIATQLGTAAR
jgi:hypothetical protein